MCLPFIRKAQGSMPVINAVYLAVTVCALVLLTEKWRIQPFLAVAVTAAAFGLLAGMSVSQVGDLFGTGFAQTVTSTGLVIVAAGMISALAEESGAMARLGTAAAAWRGRPLPSLMALAGLIAGVAASPAAAFAALTPVRRALSGPTRLMDQRNAVIVGLILAAGHGLLLPSPIPVAAIAILGADWRPVVALGLPVAAIAGIAGLVFTRFATKGLAEEGAPSPVPEASPTSLRTRRSAVALVLACFVMTALLMVQSLGAIPSEPFGGGATRQFIIGVGRPLTLLIVGVGIMLLAVWRGDRATVSDQGWLGRGIVTSAGLLLLVGAGGGWQKILQEAGLAELLGERLLDWHLGLFLPFLVAAVIKTLQGSSLVAGITAAGMIQPILGPLGLDSETGRALAVIAIGAGSVTLSHINDDHFWIVSGSAGLRPMAGLGLVAIGTLVQGLCAMAALFILAFMVI